MNRAVWKALTPAIVVAAGILVSTQVAAMSVSAGLQMTPGLLAMAGSLVMASAVVMASLLSGRLQGRQNLAASFVLGGVILVASAIIVMKDPANVANMLPVLGAGVGFSVIVPTRRTDGARCARTLRS